MRASDTKLAHLATVVCVIAGLLVGVAGSPITGSIVAGAGIAPACWGMWAGVQQKTQANLAWSILLGVASLAAAALLIVLAVIGWIR